MARPLLTQAFVLLAVCGMYPALAMENGGLEDGLNKWEVRSSPSASAEVKKEAASIGESGLRLSILSQPASCEIISPRVSVDAGSAYLARFWSGGGGAQPGSASVEMVFFDESGTALPVGPALAGKKARTAVAGGESWSPCDLGAIAPETARTVAVRIKPMAGGPGSFLDFDDFQIEKIPNPAPTAPSVLPLDSPRIAELKEEIQSNPTRGNAPPKIVLKLDDLKPAAGGNFSPQWVRATDFAKDKNIKISIGIIADGFQAECPAIEQWIKELHASNRVEFWNHGWDHAAGEKLIQEFSGQSYEYQKDHFTRASEIARTKFGFSFVSFGAPFNATDASTLRVLSEDSDIKIWIFGDAKNPAGKTVLRNSAVTIETKAKPDFEAFLDAYAHNRGAAYFVMQGHPGGWNDDSFEQFRMIVDFLIGQQAQFVFPKELVEDK